jgi:hypothetical protein
MYRFLFFKEMILAENAKGLRLFRPDADLATALGTGGNDIGISDCQVRGESLGIMFLQALFQLLSSILPAQDAPSG